MASISEPTSLLLNSGQFPLRKAAMGDIAQLMELINGYAGHGIMLHRTELDLSENIRDFTVLYSAFQLIGCGALHFYTPTSAEVRSLAVAPDLKDRGLGKTIVDALTVEAIENDLHAIFAFTYVPDFFRKMGFREVERGELPLKVWKDCLRCPKFQCCDEIAMIKHLKEDVVLDYSTEPALGLVQLPQLKS
jgi:amino-acid N-acetyltransferase